MHINFKYKVPVKNKICLKILKRAILSSRRWGLKVIHFSLQHNHVHLIVEAADNETLTRGMRSLTVTFAKRLNKGKVQIERYHLHVLRTIRETKNAIQYVLFNEQKHGSNRVDEYSSLLSLTNAIDLVRNFSIRSKMVIKIGKKDDYGELS
jgi:REP element-mobilizing transposase RayT